MKTRIQSILIPAVASGFAISSAHAGPLAAGTGIGVDFGPTAPTNFFNTVNPAPAAGGSIPAGNVIDTSNATVDGVGFSWASASTFFNNNDAISIAGQPAAFDESNLTDWIGISGNQNVQGFITLTFTGLDDSLTYDLVIGAGFNSGISDVLWTADSQSATTDSNVGANSFVTLSGLSTDGSGNLVIVGAGTGGTGNRQDIVVVSALHLTATTPTLDNRWVLNGNGNWSDTANWSDTTVPNAQSVKALLDDDSGNITGPVTATLDVPVTLGALEFNHSFAYTVAGTNALTFDDAGNDAALDVQSGNHVVSAPVTMADDLAATVASGASLELSNTLSDGGSAFSLNKNGDGDLVLSGDISAFSGPTTINAGTVTLARPGDYTLTQYFAGSGRLAFTGGGRVTLAPAFANSHGGTDLSNGGTLVADSVNDLGAGGVAFDNGTLEVVGDITAATTGWSVAAGGGTIDVAAGFTLQSGRLTGTGAMNKTGDGTWRIAGAGTGATIGLLSVSGGTLDLDRNDTFGDHATSNQDLVIEDGALVTNGILTNRGYNALRNVTLNGGELRVTGTAAAAGGQFGSYALKQTVTAGGSAPSSITDPGSLALASINLGNGDGTQTTFAVADATGDTAVDLTVSAVLQSLGTGTGLRKTGSGTMQLTRVNTYTGNTTVEEGTLILDQAVLADTADVELSTGSILQLDFAGTDTIDELLIDGSPQAAGTWGRTGHPTAQNTSSLITGDGLLQVTTGGIGGPAFDDWATRGGASGVTFEGDANGDGVPDGIAFLLGADTPATVATGLLPTADESGGDLVMQFTCLAAAARGASVLNLEYDGDLAAPWLSVPVPGAAGLLNPIVEATATGSVSFVATDGGTNGEGDALVDIVATITDATEAANGKLFGRFVGIE